MDSAYIKTLEITPYKLYYLINVECGQLTFASGGHFGFMQLGKIPKFAKVANPLKLKIYLYMLHP